MIMIWDFLESNQDIIVRVLSDIMGTTRYLNIGLIIALIYIALYVGYILICTILGREKRYGIAHATSVFLLLIYVTALLYIVFMSREVGEFEGANLRLFSSWGRTYVTKALFIENIIMFIPMGILLPSAFKRFRKPLECIVTCFLLSLFIEITQYFFHIGIAEIDDVLTNSTGGLLGYIVWGIFAVPVYLLHKLDEKIKIR